MRDASTRADEPPLARATDASLDALHRGLGWVGRHALGCSIAGAGVLALIAWYAAWHVPSSGWLFLSHYAVGFKDLVYRVQNVRNVQVGRTLYYAQLGTLQYFVYPPAALWLFWPLTWVGRFTGELLWTYASLICLAWLIASAGRAACAWRWPKAWAVALLVGAPLSALALQPVGVHLALGQVGLFLAAPAVFDLLCVRDRRLRGVLVGVTAAFKLYPIVYVAFFALRREWRAVWNALGSMAAVTALAWAVFPGYSETFFFHRLLNGGELRHYWRNDHWISSSSSLYTVFFRQPFTGSPPERAVGLVLCAAAVLLGVLAARRLLAEGREVGALLCLALGATVGSPVAWDHYFIWVVLVPFVLVERRPLAWWRTAALWLFVLACLVPLRLARNESLSHRAYDGTFLVILTARNALAVTSLVWLVAACVPARAPDPDGDRDQPRAATVASHQARSAG